MVRIIVFLTTLTFLCIETVFGQNIRPVEHFDKVIISPHIQVTLVQGSKETVTIEDNKVSNDKLNIEVNGKTLRIYLKDAKEVTKDTTLTENGMKMKRSIYKGTIVTATMTYKTLNDISVRGEETLVCNSLLKGNNFNLKIYGESHIYLNEVNLKKLQATIYGESVLEIKSGTIQNQKFTAYDESKVEALAIDSEETKITAYGEAEFKINASKKIRITSYGEASLQYSGDAEINKGLNVGGLKIRKIPLTPKGGK
ncbi:head GIN domain-containing protein [Aequorivita capsosiphonis]|uniref:head GIN domain-containing protein n=1 Tax=Aequorivita capsosiphonis TaxID=487317 RepID=UPI00047DBB8F|nr:head GIN domain-containing protein [Aequorivita capsosiphonis]